MPTASPSDAASWTRRTFSALWVRNYRLFFVGQFVSNSGNWLTIVALSLLVLHRTGSGVDVGLLGACQFGPILLLSAWAGVIADRADKRKLLYVTQSVEMAQSALLAVLAFLPHAPMWSFFAVALAGGCALAVDNPARRSFVNEMVPPPLVPNAVTLYSANVNLSRIVGPTLAAVLIATVGYGWSFALDAASYAAVLASLAMMRAAELRPAQRTLRGPGQVRAGLRYVRGVPELWIMFLTVLIIGLLSYNFTVVLPLFVEKGLHGTDSDFALMYATFSAGAVVGTLLMARRETVTVRVVASACFGMAAALLLLGVMPSVAAAFPAAAVLGSASVFYLTSTTALAQLRSDPQMIGRVLALQLVLLIGTTPLGGPLLGSLADALGARSAVWLGAIGAFVAGSLAWGLARAFVPAEPRAPAR